MGSSEEKIKMCTAVSGEFPPGRLPPTNGGKVYKIRRISDDQYQMGSWWKWGTADKGKCFSRVSNAKDRINPDNKKDTINYEIVEFELVPTRTAGKTDDFTFPKPQKIKKVEPVVEDHWK